jgi:hypothetical protein
MVYVGIDLHRKRSQVAVLDQDGKQLRSRRIANDPETFLSLLHELGDDAEVALEATYGWEWLADLLEEAGYELHLSHPLRTKAIAAARVKTDAVDARTLAHLLRTDLLPEAYIAPRELRDLRDLLRHRVALTRMRSALKHRVAAILAKNGVQPAYSDLFGAGGRRFLAELCLREPQRRRLDSLLALIDAFDGEIEQTSREIDARAKEHPYVDVLSQIRGVGRYIAMLVIAEATSRASKRPPPLRLGRADPDRALLRSSHPPRPHLRPGLAGVAMGLGRGRPAHPHRRRTARSSYERIAKRRGRQVAKVAVARKILTLCFYGLRDGEIRCLAARVRAHTHESTGGRPATRRANAVAATPAGEADPLERARAVSMATPRRPGD